MTSARDPLPRAEAVLVAQVEAALPALATARKLVQRFTDMVRKGTADVLPEWFDEAPVSGIASLARGL